LLFGLAFAFGLLAGIFADDPETPQVEGNNGIVALADVPYFGLWIACPFLTHREAKTAGRRPGWWTLGSAVFGTIGYLVWSISATRRPSVGKSSRQATSTRWKPAPWVSPAAKKRQADAAKRQADVDAMARAGGWAAHCPACQGPPLVGEPQPSQGALFSCSACRATFALLPDGQVKFESSGDPDSVAWRACGNRVLPPEQWLALANRQTKATTTGACPICIQGALEPLSDPPFACGCQRCGWSFVWSLDGTWKAVAARDPDLPALARFEPDSLPQADWDRVANRPATVTADGTCPMCSRGQLHRAEPPVLGCACAKCGATFQWVLDGETWQAESVRNAQAPVWLAFGRQALPRQDWEAIVSHWGRVTPLTTCPICIHGSLEETADPSAGFPCNTCGATFQWLPGGQWGAVAIRDENQAAWRAFGHHAMPSAMWERVAKRNPWPTTEGKCPMCKAATLKATAEPPLGCSCVDCGATFEWAPAPNWRALRTKDETPSAWQLFGGKAMTEKEWQGILDTPEPKLKEMVDIARHRELLAAQRRAEDAGRRAAEAGQRAEQAAREEGRRSQEASRRSQEASRRAEEAAREEGRLSQEASRRVEQAAKEAKDAQPGLFKIAAGGYLGAALYDKTHEKKR
jgi:hypothetical protein